MFARGGLVVAFVTAWLSLSALSLPAVAQAPAPGFSPAQRAEIIAILRNALRTDPSLLRDAVSGMQAQEAQNEAAAARAAIAGLGAALTEDAGDPVAGNPRGDVTLVEFYDVRCPFCRRMLPVVAELLKRDPGLRVVYKDLPILGPPSVLGARALLAAQLQDGYFRLHDLLMAGPPDIDMVKLRVAATAAGLDWDRLQRDMANPAIQSRIAANLELGRQLHIDGTPAYVIGNRMIAGAVDAAELQAAVAAARKR